jgi:2-aminoadipate transaminase
VPTISFARGVPTPECLPVAELADCARAVIERDGHAALAYASAGGYGPLREWVAERHGVDPGRVLLTNGSLQAFVFLAQHLLADRGARVLVEAPTYDRSLKILARLGADVTALPVDDDGLDVEALERALAAGPRPAFLYTITTFQNPSGRTLSVERRRRLADLTRDAGLLVLEDDPYGLVRFEGVSPPLLFELAGGDGVAYSSSFSKTVAPGVRVGYVVLPSELAGPVEDVAVSTYVSPAVLGQAVVFEFLRRGRLAPHLRHVCGLLRVRRDAMLAALEREFPAGARWSRPEGGYFLWVELPDGADAAALLTHASAAGVTFVKGSDFYPHGEGGHSAARLAYSFVSPQEIAEGIARLASLVPAAVSV